MDGDSSEVLSKTGRSWITIEAQPLSTTGKAMTSGQTIRATARSRGAEMVGSVRSSASPLLGRTSACAAPPSVPRRRTGCESYGDSPTCHRQSDARHRDSRQASATEEDTAFACARLVKCSPCHGLHAYESEPGLRSISRCVGPIDRFSLWNHVLRNSERFPLLVTLPLVWQDDRAECYGWGGTVASHEKGRAAVLRADSFPVPGLECSGT